MLTGIGATGSAASGRNVNAEIAKIQRQITNLQEQMQEKQGLLLSTPEGELRTALQQQLVAIANQIAMLQAQMNALRTAGVQQSAMAQLDELGGRSDTKEAKADRARVNADGVPIGSVLNVEA
jgi:prefoldin subunit 5